MRLLPRDDNFFELFKAVAERSVEAAGVMEDLLKAAPDRRTFMVETIKRLEHECDTITHEVITRLDRSFITPLDREDIHELASKLDDVIDLIDGTARRAQIFHLGEAPEGSILIAQVLKRACQELSLAVGSLKKNQEKVLPACIAVKRLEEEGDSLYHEWLGKAFEGNPDPMLVIKWKELYDNLEKSLDMAEDAANVVESIAIKHG